MESKTTLNDDTLDALQTLIVANLDSAQCLEEAAEAVNDGSLTRYFLDIATARRSHANELKGWVAANLESPTADTSAGADLRALWLKLRAAINGGDPKVLLIEAERAEDVIKARYETLLVETAGSAMNDVLMRHMREVKFHHDQIRDLRDAA